MRSFLIILLFSVVLFSKDTVEVFAEQVKATKDYLTASGDVVLLYDGALLKSDKAIYDKNASLLILSGGVEVIREDENKIYSENLEIDTKTKEIQFKELLITTEDDLWIDATEAKKENETYKIVNSRLSSCNPKKPEWTIEFAEAMYHKDKNYMTLSEAKLRFFDTPIFYFPYLAFPTTNERTSGLLFPLIQFSTTEGLAYQQPIFYAPLENFDMEFNPQIRTNRGFGGHITTRFIDSDHSQGKLRLGYFKNFENYANENNFNNEHYGMEFLYSSTDFLPKSEFLDKYKSGLYVNATYLNDLEYLNLQKDSASSLISSNLVESRLNAFMYDEKDYLGLYARYNIDLSKKDNHNTIQDLPTLQYHSFISYLISDKLFYTFDARVHNYTRVKGSRAYQTEFDLPVTFYDSFFNDYLDVAYSENLYLSNVFFSNLQQDKSNYRFYRNYHTLELSSDLSKQYGSDVHTFHPSIVYTKPSFEREKPENYKDLTPEQKELFVTQTERENLSMGVSQYYYNSELDMNLFHRLAFTQYPNDVLSKGDINNEFGYTGEDLNLYSNLFYSLDKDKLHSLTTSLGYTKSNYDIMLTHFYNYDLILDQKQTSFLHASLTHTYNRHNQWYVSNDYDLANSFNHQWNVGWSHKQKCWGAQLSFGQEQIPNIDTSFRNSIVYFELSLNPLGAVSKNIEKEFSTQGNK
jgi:LPS-assembly protein